jgi:DNA-binding CsgD family transcriptional regulator
MDDLERQIVETYFKLVPTLSPDELKSRLARRRMALLRSPPRAWCLAVRASDQRINNANAIMVPEQAANPYDAEHPYQVLPHQVTLEPTLLKKICAPVYIEPPGRPLHVVAALLGVHPTGLHRARVKGLFNQHYVKGLMHRPGRPTPILYTDKPLDPTSRTRIAPDDPLWGWTAQYLTNRIPGSLRQTVERVPVFRRKGPLPEGPDGVPRKRVSLGRLPPPPPDYVWYKWKGGVYIGDGSKPAPRRRRRKRQRPASARSPIVGPKDANGDPLLFRGWRWRCPGCGELARTIYYPLPPINIPILSGLPIASADVVAGRNGGETDAELDGLAEPIGCFACYECHGIRSFSRFNASAWNYLIAHLSGGLLYGSEVPKPADFGSQPRKARPYRRVRRCPSPGRQKVLERWLAGMQPRAIARELGIHRSTVHAELRFLCQQHEVKNGRSLAQILGRKSPAAVTSKKRADVQRLLEQGATYKEIARSLGTTYKAVQHHARNIYRQHKVQGRNRLIEKLRAQPVEHT